MLKTIKAYLNKSLSHLDIFFEDFISVLKNIFSVQKTISTEWQRSSYYNKAERKSNFKIYRENLFWLIKNKEINYLYYGFSFDKKDNPVRQESYFPALKFKRVRSQINKGNLYDYKVILRDKLLFHNFIKALNLGTPRILSVGYRDKVISLLDELRNILLELQAYIIQEKIDQHKLLARYHAGSVNTIRIMTIKNRTGVHVLDAIMRFGTGGSSVDNLSAGGIAVSVDCNKGCLNKYGYKVALQPTPVIKRVLKHDDSKILFKDFCIPFFFKAVDDIK